MRNVRLPPWVLFARFSGGQASPLMGTVDSGEDETQIEDTKNGRHFGYFEERILT